MLVTSNVMLNEAENERNIWNVMLNNSSFMLVFSKYQLEISKYKIDEAVVEDEISIVKVRKVNVLVLATSFLVDEAGAEKITSNYN